MNISICDEDYCWLCCIPGSCCSCEFSDSFWSKASSQASFCTLDSDPHEKPVLFSVDNPAFCTIDGHHFLGRPFENLHSGSDDVIHPFGGPGSQHPHAASTPKNNSADAEQWGTPGATSPPESSSPIGPVIYPPYLTDPALPTPTSRHKDSTVDRPLAACGPCDNGPPRVEAPFKAQGDSNITIFPTTMSSPAEATSSMPDLPSSLDDGTYAIGERPAVASPSDLRVVTKEPAVENSIHDEKPREIKRMPMPRSLIPAPGKRAISSAPTLLDLTMSTGPGRALSQGAKRGSHRDATTASQPRKASVVSGSSPVQATSDNDLKRRRSSFDHPLEPKKTKLDKTVSHLSCASDASATSKYQALKPASIRRAQSLRSDISACSQPTTDSQFYPSPLSSLAERPGLDKDCPPTAPSTPLPTSADYARSKANPLARTIPFYRHRSLEVPAIPPVPIIAPPPYIAPTVVLGAEDHAISRLKALLLRERSERERDGLLVHDEKRRERLRAMFPVFSRQDSAGTSDSSEDYSQLEEKSTCSATESKESRDDSLSTNILPEQLRLANWEAWSTAFGITNKLRKEIISWTLRARSGEPDFDNLSQRGRPRGTDLYDQLLKSCQTRFFATQLFHRYFLRPEKAHQWKPLSERERLERGNDFEYQTGVWNIALGCVALTVKLHRDCFPPLEPVFAAEFLKMAPLPITHEAFESVQRDVFSTFQFQLGSCTPQDVLDELWNALPTLRKATTPISWAAVQTAAWDKLYASFFEPDMLQYPITLLTAAALIDGLLLALANQYKKEAAADICACGLPFPECDLSGGQPTSWQICLHEAERLVDDVILDVRDVLEFPPMELDECRKWLSYVREGHRYYY